MKLAIVLLLCVAIVSASEIEQQFQIWRVANHKFYANAGEYQKRFAIFSENVKRIDAFNAEEHSFTVGLNQFSDMSNDEFRAVYLLKSQEVPMNVGENVLTGVAAPDSVDWRTQGKVNPVKDQGQCGSCWSFGANAAMEGAWAMAGNALASFSEQNILDCSWSIGNQGCNGGWHNWAMDYVIQNGGIDSEASYPYTASASRTCKYNSANSAGRISSHTTVSSNEDSLKEAVAGHVVAIAIDASNWSFQQYKTGVYDEPKCSSTSLDHAVAAVGYGNEGGKDYWIVRNSWGSSWGMNGYILMSRNKNNQCGVATKAYYATA
jgi:cathepsin L